MVVELGQGAVIDVSFNVFVSIVVRYSIDVAVRVWTSTNELYPVDKPPRTDVLPRGMDAVKECVLEL